MLRKMRLTMKEREEKINDQIQQTKDKLKNENAKTFGELLKLVILNSLMNIIFKMPSCFTSLNDFRLIVIRIPIHNGELMFNHKSVSSLSIVRALFVSTLTLN